MGVNRVVSAMSAEDVFTLSLQQLAVMVRCGEQQESPNLAEVVSFYIQPVRFCPVRTKKAQLAPPDCE